MAESFAFTEGTLYLWTGQNPSSAVAYVQDVSVTLNHGYVNQQAVNGNYFDVLTGTRADVTFSVVYTPDMTLYKMFKGPTAIHMKLDHNHAGGSAGFLLYSGKFDSIGAKGREGSVYTLPMQYHANVWSGYG